MNNYDSTLKKLVIARSISSFGSAFSDFILPLFIYEITKSPSLLAFQWSLNAFSKFTAGKVSGQFHILKTNKQALVFLDVLQGGFALLPLILWNINSTIGTFISGIAISFLFTIQAGYLDSTIVNLTRNDGDINSKRSELNASLDSGKNIGQCLGYFCAWLCSALVGYKLAIFIDSITFFVSALITVTIIDNSKHDINLKMKESFSLLFNNKFISILTMSQCFLSFALFIYNSSYIFVLKDLFKAPDAAIAIFLASQSISYIFGSLLAKRFKNIHLKNQVQYRFLYLLIFVGFFFSQNYIQFILLNCFLSLLISFTQPKIISIFQSFSTPTNSRTMGSARTSIMALSGLLGSITCWIYSFLNFEFKFIFIFGGLACSISLLMFHSFIKCSCHLENLK